MAPEPQEFVEVSTLLTGSTEPKKRFYSANLNLSAMEKKQLSSVVALIIIMCAFGFLTQGVFFEARNISNLLRQTAIVGILGVGMTWVILLGSIDLSVGSVAGLIGILVAIAQTWWGWGAAGIPGVITTVVVATAAGALLGAFNGAWIAGLRVHGFVITFGMMVIARGVAMILSNGSSISPMGPQLNYLGAEYITGPLLWMLMLAAAVLWMTYTLWDEKRGRQMKSITPTWRVAAKVSLIGGLFLMGYFVFESFKGLPIPVLIYAVVAFAGSWILNRTRFGRYIYAVGGNPEAARLAGISVRKITFTVFTVMGMLAGISAVVLTARLNGATPTAGNLFELDAIAAVVIGGTSLMGGKGSVVGTVIGALIIESLNNGMSLLNVESFYQMPLKGAIVILAVAIDSLVEKRKD